MFDPWQRGSGLSTTRSGLRGPLQPFAFEGHRASPVPVFSEETWGSDDRETSLAVVLQPSVGVEHALGLYTNPLPILEAEWLLRRQPRYSLLQASIFSPSMQGVVHRSSNGDD
jgi:hypothetical protein